MTETKNISLRRICGLLLAGGMLLAAGCAKKARTIDVEYVPQFENVNHPQIACWVLTPQDLSERQYLSDLDTLARHAPFDLLFLTARQGTDFYDFDSMEPVFSQIVERAHEKGLKIGLLLGEDRHASPAPDQAQWVVTEQEITLDGEGYGRVCDSVRHLSEPDRITGSELYRAWAFRKTADGEYEPGSLIDITPRCKTDSAGSRRAAIEVIGSPELGGYTAYILTRHTSDACAPYDKSSAQHFVRALQAYRHIPFDGVGLEGFTNLSILPPSRMKGDTLTERYCSQAMSEALNQKYWMDMPRTLFDMRYVPVGKPEIRMKAINAYMDIMRGSVLRTEKTVAYEARKLFGEKTFISRYLTARDLHSEQFGLNGEKIWTTGLKEWSSPCDYTYSDGNGPLGLQLGLAMSGTGNLLYRTTRDEDIDRMIGRALTGLRYGIRTHYMLDRRTDIDDPLTRSRLRAIEQCTRLLNRFDPALPDVKLLVVFGVEALSNWYPDQESRGAYDINCKLAVEEKIERLWQAGYMHALVPSDVIVDGKLQLDADNKPTMNGHTFDAVIYLYPEYARSEVVDFLDKYVSRGGKLMIEGNTSHDFRGERINTSRWLKIYQLAKSLTFSFEEVFPSLGVERSDDAEGVRMEDGSWIFTDRQSLTGDRPAAFAFTVGDDRYTGLYHGMAAVQADPGKGLQKLAAHRFREIACNGKMLLSLPEPADIYLEIGKDATRIIVADTTGRIKPLLDNL